MQMMLGIVMIDLAEAVEQLCARCSEPGTRPASATGQLPSCSCRATSISNPVAMKTATHRDPEHDHAADRNAQPYGQRRRARFSR